jgi:cytochrome c5
MKKRWPMTVNAIRYLYRVIGYTLFLAAATSGLQAGESVRNGKQVYDTACGACHTAGVLQAPRLGNQEDWIAREKQGFEVLLSHAIKGFKNMPAKGGNPTIKDKEIENAINYMLVASGLAGKKGVCQRNATAGGSRKERAG